MFLGILEWQQRVLAGLLAPGVNLAVIPRNVSVVVFDVGQVLVHVRLTTGNDRELEEINYGR